MIKKGIVLGLVFGLALTGKLSAQEKAVENTGLVGYWSFDEGKGDAVSDFSGNKNQGATKGGAEWVEGVKGKALKFNGKDAYVVIETTESLRTLNEISIEAWIFPTPPHQQGYGGIINNINGTSHSRLLVTDDGKLAAQLHGTEGSDTVYGPKVDNNAWNHVVYVYNGEEEMWYLNGVEVASSPYDGLPRGPAAITIGWGYTTPEYYHFNGIIDEVRIYQRALTDKEIQEKFKERGMI
ncbi:MAG: LamG domain-containing protein [Candidatus Omnitrophota bacterium]